MSFSSFTADLSLELLVWWSVVLFVSLGALILFVATRTPLRSSKVGSDSSSRPSREMEGLSEISTTSEVPCHKSFQKWCPQQVNYFGDKISGNHSFGVLQFWAPVISIHIICYIYTYLPPLPLSLSHASWQGQTLASSTDWWRRCSTCLQIPDNKWHLGIILW